MNRTLVPQVGKVDLGKAAKCVGNLPINRGELVRVAVRVLRNFGGLRRQQFNAPAEIVGGLLAGQKLPEIQVLAGALVWAQADTALKQLKCFESKMGVGECVG